MLTAVGTVTVSRPYFLCPHCHTGFFPADAQLDLVDTEFSPGVRRMQALVGQDASFDHGRQQMQLLAGLEVTTKSVERVAKPSAPTLLSVSNTKSIGSSNSTSPSSPANRFPCSMFKWTAPACPW